MPRVARNVHGLSEKQEAFAVGYVNGKSLQQAAKDAGYTGWAGNSSRLAAQPLIKARIEMLREDRAHAMVVRREAQKHAITSEFAAESEQVSLKMLIMEARVNLDGARADGKWKDALENLKFMAELTGYLSSGGDKSDANKRRPHEDDPPQSPNPINLQVINQFAQRLDRDPGDEPQALEAIAVPFIPPPDGDDGDE